MKFEMSQELKDEISPAISDSIFALPIVNIARVRGNIVRGETLAASRNRKYIEVVKEAGVDVVIDFRTADHTDKFAEVCAGYNLECYHFPVDKANMSDEEMIKTLPLLFELLDTRNCYISCQQGMHRTDIALAIYYMFHRPEIVPDLRGHKKNGTLRCDDIMRRLNSLFVTLSQMDDEETGIKIFNEAEFRRRRKLLLETNRRDVAGQQTKG